MSDVYNVMENLVEENLDKCMENADICTCELCCADVKALALNKLIPHYASTLQGNLITRIDNMRIQASTDVLAAIMEGIAIVAEHPRHDNP